MQQQYAISEKLASSSTLYRIFSAHFLLTCRLLDPHASLRASGS